jgi:hypothetical protein
MVSGGFREMAMTKTVFSPGELREAGLTVLAKNLGPTTEANFMRQYSTGNGNWNEDRKKIFDAMTVEDIDRELDNFSTNYQEIAHNLFNP